MLMFVVVPRVCGGDGLIEKRAEGTSAGRGGTDEMDLFVQVCVCFGLGTLKVYQG